MSAIRMSRPAAIALLLLVAAVTLLVIELQDVPPGDAAEFKSNFVAMAILILVPLVEALFWGAAIVGLAALWNVRSDQPLRHPVLAFAIGVTAYVVVQALGTAAYQDYKMERRATASPQSIPSEPPAAKETK
jgi:hypothetical protein